MTIKTNQLNICNVVSSLHYSGFCLTDNINFAEFYIFKFPKLNQKFLPFKFNKEELAYELGERIEPLERQKEVFFGEQVQENKLFYRYFIEKYKVISFYWLKSFHNKECMNSVGLVKDGKLIGLLKTKERK